MWYYFTNMNLKINIKVSIILYGGVEIGMSVATQMKVDLSFSLL